jgi:hypothetical protein
MSCLSPSPLLCNADVLVAATVCVPTLLQPNKPKKPKRPWEKELEETNTPAGLQVMGRKQARAMMVAANKLQLILDKTGGGPGKGGAVVAVVHKKKIKGEGSRKPQQASASLGMPFDQQGIYMFDISNTASKDAFKPLATMAMRVEKGGKSDASATDKARYAIFMRNGSSSHSA